MCCLFGIVDYERRFTGRQKSRLLSILSRECEIRGTDATGIAYNAGGRLCIYKRPLPAHRMRLLVPDDAAVIMGHTRMTTQGSEKHNYNNHPFPGSAGGTRFALAHNGVLWNELYLQRRFGLPDSKIQTDSYVAVQLLEHQNSLDMDSLRFMAEQVEGSFSFTVLDEWNNLYFVKGDNPLCIYRFPKSGVLVYASTEEILTAALQKLWLPLGKAKKVTLNMGEILKVDTYGDLSSDRFDTSKLECPWFSGRCTPYSWDFEPQSYERDIRTMASMYGYSSNAVDALLTRGFSLDEIESVLFEGV